MTIDLSSEEFDMLLLALGYATGAAHKENEKRLMYSFVRLTNAVNRDNPNYIPYQVPEE